MHTTTPSPSVCVSSSPLLLLAPLALPALSCPPQIFLFRCSVIARELTTRYHQQNKKNKQNKMTSVASSLEHRLAQLAKRFDAIEGGLRHLQQQMQQGQHRAGTTSVAAAAAAATGAAKSGASVPPTSTTDLSKLQPDPKDPPEVARLRQHCLDHGLHSAVFQWVPSNYYQENLQWRRDALQAPSIQHLCKTILMENTHCTRSDCADRNNSRYYFVVYQYVDRFNSDMVGRVLHERNPGLGKKKFNLRLADPMEAEKLTGVRSGAVAPFGSSVNIPVILSAGISQLAPAYFYVGGGHVDCKCRLDVEEFVRVVDPIVATVTVPLTEEELLQIAD
jgi:hypothetical protein